MAGGRSTEVLEKETGNVTGNVTQRLVEPAKKTERMEQRNPANVTWIMQEDSEGSSPVQVGMGTEIFGYLVKDIVS